MKTAVEWLYEELWKQTDFSLPNNLLEQAKEMEKQQKEVAYQSGYLDCYTKLMNENLTRKI